MKEKGKQFLWVHTLLFLLTGFGIRLLLKRFFPSYAIGSYFLIPTFFYLFGLGSFQSFLRIRMKSGKTIVHTYMILRTVKIVLSLLMVITYWLIDKPNGKYFALIFALFYLLYLIWETFAFLKVEKYYKHREETEPSSEKVEHS